MADENVIVIQGYKPHLTESGIASVDLTPGELAEYGGSDDFRPHSTAGGFAQPVKVVREREYKGDEISDDIPAGDTVEIHHAQSGELLHMFLADGQNVSKGDKLESDGAGALQAQGTGGAPNEVVAEAAEALNNTSGSPSRIKARAV